MGNRVPGEVSRGSLRAALEKRRPELEEAMEQRIFAIPDALDADPVYREGLAPRAQDRQRAAPLPCGVCGGR